MELHLNTGERCWHMRLFSLPFFPKPLVYESRQKQIEAFKEGHAVWLRTSAGAPPQEMNVVDFIFFFFRLLCPGSFGGGRTQ